MSCDSVAIVSTPPSSSAPDQTDVMNGSVAVSESPTPPPPQALPLITTTTTTSNSSRCTSPMSPPSVSDQNVSAATSSNEDESMSAVMNLTMNKSNSDNNNNIKNNNSTNGSPTSLMMKHNNHHSGSKRPSSNHINNHQTNIMLKSFNIIEQLRQQQQLQMQQLNSHHNNNKMNKMISNEYSNAVATSRNSIGGGKSSINNNKMIRNRHRNHNNSNSNNTNNNRNSNQLLDSTSYTNSPDFTQLLLEYRQVLLDVLAKTIKFNNGGADDTTTPAAPSSSSSSPQQMESIHKGIILPIKCQCGYTSELSKHITRISTYVHQLELKFHSLLESIKISTDPNRYTPKRPWFIDTPAMMTPTTAAASAPLSSLAPQPQSLYPLAPVTKVSSLLDKKKSSRMSSMIADKQQQPISLFSGNNSINGSLNGDDDDIDSDEDDVNHHEMNLSENHIYTNGSIDETNHHQIPNNNAINNVAGKTILEGYLESMKQNIPSDDDDDDEDDDGRSDEEDGVKLNQTEIVDDIIEDDDEELDGGSIGEEDCPRGPGKRIDINTKKLVVQMQRSGASFTDISRQIGISRKSVRRIISNYRAYGLLEKKRECRIQKGMQDLILRLYSQGRSYTQISRATTISKPTIAKIIKQLTDSNIFAKGPTNGLMMNANGNGAISAAVAGGGGVGQDSLIIDNINDDMDEEREMIVDERVDCDDDGDIEFEEDDDEEEEDDYVEDKKNKKIKEPNLINSFTLYPIVQPQHQPQQQQSQSHPTHNSVNKSRRNMSLIQGPYNNGGGGGGSMKQSHQYPSTNGVGLLHNNNNNNRLSLIKPQQDRFKPYDLKVKQNSSNETTAPVIHHHRRAHSIVPPLPTSATHLYGIHPQANRSMPQVKMYDNNNNNSKLTKKIDSNNNNTNDNNSKHHHHVRDIPRDNNNGMIRSDRHKSSSSSSSNKMSSRQSVDMPSFKESLIVPEIADKNNNTTLNNCNMTLTNTSNSMNGSRSNNNDSNNNNNTNNNNSTTNNNNGANLPPIPASLIEGNSDSDASLVPRNFIDNFPAGIMNSLNPNRATKLTLEDFNIVWQLRSQHWTHNQIRKYFQQRGKSISKSSISRIMNGKQRNFQQFFSVVPSGTNF